MGVGQNPQKVCARDWSLVSGPFQPLSYLGRRPGMLVSSSWWSLESRNKTRCPPFKRPGQSINGGPGPFSGGRIVLGEGVFGEFSELF